MSQSEKMTIQMWCPPQCILFVTAHIEIKKYDHACNQGPEAASPTVFCMYFPQCVKKEHPESTQIFKKVHIAIKMLTY